MRNWIYNWSGYSRIQKLIESEPNQSADTFLRKGIAEFKVSTDARGASLPEMRGTVFLSNHHTGLLDLLAAYPLLAPIAPRLKTVVNHQIGRLTPMRGSLILVHPISSGRRNLEAREEMIQHLRDGGNILLYPAGKVARAVNGVVQDYEWRLGSAEILQQHAQHVVPILVDAHNSQFFYRMRDLFPRLNLLFILRELHTRASHPTAVYLGRPIPRSEIQAMPAGTVMKYLRHRLYNLKEEYVEPGTA